MFKYISLVFLAAFLNIKHTHAQDLPDFQWWADAHNWDGVTHWSRYIKRLPGYMGPNALPIPQIKNAKTGNSITFESAFEYHKGTGEYATNPYFNLQIPIVDNKAALEFIYRPFEYYDTEEFIRHERFGRNKDCKGYAKSDLYIGTLVQLFNEDAHKIDAVIRIMLKTTTGKDFANARHTDAPGYHFDLNLGRTLYKSNGFFKDISVYTMTGLYVWQMEFDNNRQNDAYLYGLRTDFDLPYFSVSSSFSGYSGYMNMRDKPMALRLTINKKNEKATYYISYQKGLRDIINHSFRLGFNYSFNIKKKEI